MNERRRERKRKEAYRKRMTILISFCIISFLLGALTHKCYCLLLDGISALIESNEETDPVCTIEDSEPSERTIPETPIPEETEFVSYYEYTAEELDLLARLIESEGGTESYSTKLKIGSVVMNRVEDPYFPNTIYEVIYQKNQFSVTTYKINGVVMIDRPASDESIHAAREILDYGSVLPSTVQVFYAKWCTESWVTSRETYEVCDNTVFAHIYAKE